MPVPVVSVVVPAFKQAALISASLDSIAAQTFAGSVEVIVVDDGCPEGTGDAAARHTLGPTVIRQPNQGVAAARNTGIAASTGRYIAFLDADDQWLPEKLEVQVRRLEQAASPALCFCRYQTVDDKGVELPHGLHPGEFGEPGPHTLFRGNYIGCLTAIVDRRCLERVGGFPRSAALQRGGQDYALWLRISLHYPLLYEPRVLARYVQHGRSRVGLDALKNFEGALNAITAVWERDRELCARTLDQSHRSLVVRQSRLVARRLWTERSLDWKTWRRVWASTRSALRPTPSAERATWPEPLSGQRS